MQFIIKAVLWTLKKLYYITGLEWLVEEIMFKVRAYRIRLNIVPTTFKLFVWILGVAFGASSTFLYLEMPTFESKVMTFENVRPIETVQAAEVVVTEPVKEWQEAEFSAYTASADETDSSPLIMASGKMVYVGSIACPRSMKLGTRIEVRGLGEFVCEDRMNERYTNHFDLFMLTKSEALKFGRKVLEYRVQ